jgi:hypothetical protein
VETFSRGTLAAEYVTGLVEAAGSFTYSRSSKQLAVYFALKLPLADRALLEDLQAFFGVGRIYETGNSAYYRVTRHQDLPAIVAHFRRHPLRSRKRTVFETWTEMVEAKQRFRKPDRALLDSLAERMRARG